MSLIRLEKRLKEAEHEIKRMRDAFRQMNIVPCSCCNRYLPKDFDALGTTKGPVCMHCVCYDEDALESGTVDKRSLNGIFWTHYRKFLKNATADGKRYLSGAPINLDMPLIREDREIAMVLWDYAEANDIRLTTQEGDEPSFNPSNFTPCGKVWLWKYNKVVDESK